MPWRVIDQPWRHRNLEVSHAILCYKFDCRYFDTRSWEEVYRYLQLLHVVCIASIDGFIYLEK